MPSLSIAIASNEKALQGGIQIITTLNSEQYASVSQPYARASIGSHFRHIIDHYYCLLGGLASSTVNYDDRARDRCIEHDANYARRKLEDVIQQLARLDSSRASQPLQVSLRTTLETEEETPVASTLHRELIFLHGHTTHHFSQVALLLRLLDVPVDDALGVSPSTQAYRQDSACISSA